MPNTTVPAVARDLPSRRRAFARLAAADPTPSLFAESRRLCELLHAGAYASEKEADAMMDQWRACEAVARDTPATTPTGAIASLEWALAELREFGFSPDRTDNGTRLVIALLDGALGVLRSMGGVS